MRGVRSSTAPHNCGGQQLLFFAELRCCCKAQSHNSLKTVTFVQLDAQHGGLFWSRRGLRTLGRLRTFPRGWRHQYPGLAGAYVPSAKVGRLKVGKVQFQQTPLQEGEPVEIRNDKVITVDIRQEPAVAAKSCDPVRIIVNGEFHRTIFCFGRAMNQAVFPT